MRHAPLVVREDSGANKRHVARFAPMYAACHHLRPETFHVGSFTCLSLLLLARDLVLCGPEFTHWKLSN